MSWPGRTRVVVAGSAGAFRAALPPGVELGDEVVGVAFSGHNLIVVRNAPRIREVFTHETSHIALLAAVRGRPIPRWFIEGFAAYQSGEGSFARLATLTRASVAGSLLPLRDLERSFPARHDAADLAYAQSAELVSYLLGTFGRPPFQDLLSALTRGEPFFEALERAYGKPLAEIEREYVRDLRRRYNWVPILTGSATLWLGITLVFLIAVWRKRQVAKRRMAGMEDDGDG